MLTNAKFNYFLGRKKERELGKQIFMSKNCEIALDSLLGSKMPSAVTKNQFCPPKTEMCPSVADRHFKRMGEKRQRQFPPKKELL